MAHQHLRSLVPIMNDDDDDGQMIFGDLVVLKLPDICLTGEKNPEETSSRKLDPTGDRTRARCMTGVHATTCYTAVDKCVEMCFMRKYLIVNITY